VGLAEEERGSEPGSPCNKLVEVRSGRLIEIQEALCVVSPALP